MTGPSETPGPPKGAERTAPDGATTGPFRTKPKLRRLFLVLLLTYSCSLVVAGWPSEYRPAFLDQPASLIQRALLLLNIRPGIAVFEFEGRRDWYESAYCLHVRGTDWSGQQVALWPPEKCGRPGFRLRLPPRDLAYLRLIQFSFQIPDRRELNRRAQMLMENLGRHFCHTALEAKTPVAQVSFAAYQNQRRYSSGETRAVPLFGFSWSCRAAKVQEVHWIPDESGLRAFWGGSPWQD